MGSQEDVKMEKLSNSIDGDLKEDLDRALSGCDYEQRTVLSAAIDNVLTEDGDGRVVIHEDKIEDKLEYYGDLYK